MSVVSSARVAEVLRAARDLMNHGGAHWIKGAEEGPLNSYRDDAYDAEKDKYIYGEDEVGWCSIGGVKKVAKEQREEWAAMIELARVIDPKAVEDATEWNTYEDAKGNPGFNEASFAWAIQDIIAEANDDEETTWTDVKGWFTKAARRAAQRKS